MPEREDALAPSDRELVERARHTAERIGTNGLGALLLLLARRLEVRSRRVDALGHEVAFWRDRAEARDPHTRGRP